MPPSVNYCLPNVKYLTGVPIIIAVQNDLSVIYLYTIVEITANLKTVNLYALLPYLLERFKFI